MEAPPSPLAFDFDSDDDIDDILTQLEGILLIFVMRNIIGN